MTEQEKTEFFELHYEEIEGEIEKRRNKWQLRGVMMLEFSDVKQIVLAHIYKKLHLYKQDLPLLNWVNTITTNQISNVLRNNYYSHSRPCIQKGGCSFNEGNDSNGNGLCSYTPNGFQCKECPLYETWTKSKKNANDIRMAVPESSHINEIFNIPNCSSDLTNQINEMHSKMQKYLKPFEYKIYECLFILGLSEVETAKRLNYSSKEKFKYPGYASISKAKKVIITKARKIMEDGEIDIL